MNRKLHNTLMAVIASSSLLTLGLIAGSPVMPSLHGPADPSAFAAQEDAPALPDAATQDGKSASAAGRPHARAARGNRQSVSMPFFSFFPRG